MLEREELLNSIRFRLQEYGYSQSKQLNHPILDSQEYDTLASFSQKDDIECQHLLFACSGRLVHDIVSSYIHNNSDNAWTYDDLMQSGFLGISYALKKWDIEEGRFTTYATYYIRREVIRQIHRLDNIIFIRDPNRSLLVSKLPYLRDLCENEYGTEVSNDVFAEWLNKNGHSKNVKNGNINGNDILRMDEVRVSTSLDSTIGSEDETTILLDTIIDENIVSPISVLIKKEEEKGKKLLAKRLIGCLTEKQKLVIELYYGFDKAATCQETGRVSFHSVAQVIKKRKVGNWNRINCQKLHNRALDRMRKFIEKLNVKIEKLGKYA